MKISDIKFDENGLIPAVIQDFYSKRVLTVAYMNKQSLEISIREKRTCFWSRSRHELWRKGQTSGNVQHIVSIVSDCDNDALVINVIKDGPACHEGTDSCFTHALYGDMPTQYSLGELFELLLQRRKLMPAGSYTTYLFEKGKEKILKKVGEESTEVVIAAMKNKKDETVFEISDLAYHVLVLMAECKITPEEIIGELTNRHVIDKKEKQETMK